MSIARGVGGAGSGVKIVVGETRGAAGSNGGSVRTVIGCAPKASASVFVRASKATCVAPRQRASGASANSGGSLPASGRAAHARLPRVAFSVPSAATSTRSATRATTNAVAATCPPRSTAGGALGTNVPSTTTMTSAASAAGS